MNVNYLRHHLYEFHNRNNRENVVELDLHSILHSYTWDDFLPRKHHVSHLQLFDHHDFYSQETIIFVCATITFSSLPI